jgi:chlorobactene glucosyltransferase
MSWLFFVLTLPWLVVGLHTLVNVVWYRRLSGFATPPKAQPKLSILVPARNEEATLPHLIPSLLAQDYPNVEIVILNDGSTDQTQAILESFSDPRLRVVQGTGLREGWRGKPNACEQLVHASSGDLMAFTDADTTWLPQTASRIVAAFESTNADVISAWSEQTLTTWLSHLVQPFLAWSIGALLPMRLAEDKRFPGLTSANGQLLVYRREVYHRFGGFERVKASILEDIEVAKLLKSEGYRYLFMNGVGAIRCTMYNSNKDLIEGFSRNFFASLGHNTLGLFATIVVFVWLFWGPMVWLVLSGSPLAFLTCCLMWLSRWRTDAEFAHPHWLFITAPFSVLVWAWLSLLSWQRFRTGNVVWKGRTYDLRK